MEGTALLPHVGVGGDCAVRQQTQKGRAITLRLREVLRHVFDSVVTEPLPERWVDLINRLNEADRKEAEAKQQTRH
jgi:hypothetical protein